jgi:hypothetical protein
LNCLPKNQICGNPLLKLPYFRLKVAQNCLRA